MKAPSSFADFFQEATGNTPYAFQSRLAELERPPSVLLAPTGAGKTEAVVASWAYQRMLDHAPRRLVYALPMRTLVEQTAGVAKRINDRLAAAGYPQFNIHVLMGGELHPTEDWRLTPEQSQVLVGTIDMLLSRALNRGYAESRYQWPISFGLLNTDCRWVFDEVQLMGPARTTSAQLDGLRKKLGVDAECESMWVSATVDCENLRTFDRPEVGEVLTLPENDRAGSLANRLRARKVLSRRDLSHVTAGKLAKEIATAALEAHETGSRTLVVLNTVRLAQDVYASITKNLDSAADIEAVLLHSRFRPRDRQIHMASATADELAGGGQIVVATQVVEAGVDMSCRTLLTETAPFSSIVQRLGRCNRRGEYERADVIWLDRGPVARDTMAAPYHPINLDRARDLLLPIEGESLSPEFLEHIASTHDIKEYGDEPVALRRKDLLELFDTAPDLSGTDIDVAPFIREDDERNVSVLFRDLPKNDHELENEPAPHPDELVQVPRHELAERTCLVIDHVDGRWTPLPPNLVAPGSVVVLAAAEGGYSTDLGWHPTLKEEVEPVSVDTSSKIEGTGSDPWSSTREPVQLEDHLKDVAKAARELATKCGVAARQEVLEFAGALHDIGKAHPVFQQTMRRAMGILSDDQRLWAKSDKRGRHSRPYFRHELASALIASQCALLPAHQRALVSYLVAAHHGRVRVSIRPATKENPVSGNEESLFALGIVDGDELPEISTPLGTIPKATLRLEPMLLGGAGSWTNTVLQLRDDPDLGPFRLAYLESLLRIADWRVSR